MQPVILVTTDRRDGGPAAPGPRVRPKRAEAWVNEAMITMVREAGGLPLLLPPGPADVGRLLALADGVVLTGGYFDIPPSHYGQEVLGRLDRVEAARTDLELTLARACLQGGVPVLGICGGHQVLAVAAGGSLVQDIGTQLDGALEHEQPTDPATPWHEVPITGIARFFLGDRMQANSTHHQAVADPGTLQVCGRTEDGVVEVIAGDDPGFALGVQWHPEHLHQLAPFQALIAAATRQA